MYFSRSDAWVLRVGGKKRRWLADWIAPIATMLISGLWHGTGWNFLLWGLYYGVLLAICQVSGWNKVSGKKALIKFFSWGFTFGLVILGWMIFRAPSVDWLVQTIRYSPWGASGNQLIALLSIFAMMVIYIIPIIIKLLVDKAGRMQSDIGTCVLCLCIGNIDCLCGFGLTGFCVHDILTMKKKILIFIIVFVILFTSLNVVVMQAYEVDSYPVEKAESFDEYIRTDYREKINKEKSQIVIIGDSAIRELDQDIFSQVIGKKTLLFSAPGTGSAYWYLFMRHQVLEADIQPEYIFFFFRNVTLTTPSYLVFGSYYTRLDEIASPVDSDVYSIAINSTKSPFLKIPEKYVPLFAYRSEIYQNIVAQIRNWLPGMLLNCDDVCIDNAFDRVFDDYQINAYLWEELVRNLDVSLDQAENYDFNANIR